MNLSQVSNASLQRAKAHSPRASWSRPSEAQAEKTIPRPPRLTNSPGNQRSGSRRGTRAIETRIRRAAARLSIAERRKAGSWRATRNLHGGCGRSFPQPDQRLTTPPLETLAIIAYRQPITPADVEAVRGVAIESVLQTLMDTASSVARGVLKCRVGRCLRNNSIPLEHFGLRNLDELPNSEELKRRELPKAPLPATPQRNPRFCPDEAGAVDGA